MTASPSGRASASGGARLGGRPAPPVPDDLADLVEVSHHEDTGPTEEEPTSSYDDDPSGASTAPPPKPQGGILGRARAGAANLRSTPYGSAGRVRPPPSSPPQTSSAGPEHTHPLAGGEKSPATRGGTPLGAAPKAGMSVAKGAPRLSAPLGFPDTPDRADRRNADESGAPKLPGGMFGTPAPIARNSRPPISVAAAVEVEDEVSVMEEEEDAPTARTTATANTETIVRKLPTFGPIEDDWLNEALQKAESLLRSFPMQAYLEFNQEPNLPFTLVIARATPAMAVRAMVNFVEFLAGIATPVRARIELVNVAHLDRSFHKNVEAALEPYFGGNVEIEPNPGRVDIRFTDPDPQWGAWPQLPIVEE